MPHETRTGERVYQEIKRRILEGELRLRERLDVEKLAKDLRVSTTPVRQALSSLSVERLIVTKPPRGYFVTLWSETELGDLYRWRGMLAEMALRQFSGTLSPPQKAATASYEQRLLRLLQPFEGSANPELKRAIANADDRLHAARIAEGEVFDDAASELARLGHVLASAGGGSKYTAIRRYHDRRARAAKQIRELAAVKGLPSNGV